MALTITSPGVQINEIDLSLRANLPTGTNVVVPGFASQGPSTEPILITTISELEATYGTPTTPAERYFYYSCKEVLNSPATLTTIRLPYGAGSGEGFAQAYSGLFYPMTSGAGSYTISEPVHQTLSLSAYNAIAAGNFTWGNSTSAGVSVLSGEFVVGGGFFILNDIQTAINELGEGYYVGLADNIGLSATTVSYNAVTAIETLTTVAPDAGNGFSSSDGYSALIEANTNSTNRIDFQLSATSAASDQGIASVSQTIQSVGFAGFGYNEYSDHISLAVFKLRRSTVDATLFSIINTEKYIGSLDVNRRQASPTGGTLANAFVEDVVKNSSSTINLQVNPAISEARWYNQTTGVRSQVQIDGGSKALYPLGVYTPNATQLDSSKVIGEVPLKLDRAFRTIEAPENLTIDVIVDAGLSTIYSTTEYLGATSYDDTAFVDNVSELNENWTAVTAEFINFVENTRKDCMAIIDPSRQIFVQGKDSKVLSIAGNTFTDKIYQPLKTQIGQYNTSNYATTYGNWVKVNDLYSGKNIWVPFSGYAAAVFARNDKAAQPWSAPGGLNRGTFKAIDIAINPNQKQRDKLYETAVNPVVFFNGDGYAVYGQKTLQTKPTAFDRINVRRLFLALERSVQRTIKYFVFEPNTDITRTRLVNTLSPIFDYAKNTQGLYDYLIVCDQRNNTTDVIDQNQLIVDIYLKPVKTAEFILVNFIATTTGQDFNELI